MAMSKEQMDQRMDEHFGFEERDDIEGVLGTLAEGARHDIIGWPTGPTTSHEDMRQFYATLFGDLSDGKVKTIRRFYGENFLVDESEWSGKAPGRPFGIEGRNRPLKFRLLHVVEFGEDTKLKSEQVWLDFPSLMAQLPQE
ncbi:MAG: ester cyclase [Chrysiogenetes bacterium]|nr:ester cyclase [Chrysiogenetes bacterium]